MRVFIGLTLPFCLVQLVPRIQCREIQVDIDGTEPIHIVNSKSPSFAIGMGLFKYGWMKYLSTTKLLTLVKGLGPSFLRIGGTKSDHSTFVPGNSQSPDYPDLTDCIGATPDAREFQEHRIRASNMELEDKMLKLNGETVNVTYTGSEFDEFMTFVKCSKMNLIFGLNLLERKNKSWDPNNTQELLHFAKEKRYSIDWELGNEPNSYFHKTGIKLSASDVSKGFFQLNNILRSDTWWKKSRLVGPDANGMARKSSKQFYNKFLHYAGTVIKASTFHQYYINGKTATIDNFTDAKILNQLFPIVKDVVEIAKRQTPNVPVWLGETSSAFGGGAEYLSDTYVAGFMWLDKLGICAAKGIDTVFRQTLLQGNYAMINDNFDPNPDYWLTLLYKQLVGPRVLNTTYTTTKGRVRSSATGSVRVYAHCTNTQRTNYTLGSVTIYYMNLTPSGKTMSFDSSTYTAPKVAMSYSLTSSPTSLNSSSVYLNDEKLQLIDVKTLPILKPQEINLVQGEKIRLKKKSFGFVVLPDVNMPACLQEQL